MNNSADARGDIDNHGEQEQWWDRVTADPISLFTFWLTAFTGLLFVSTFFLWWETRGLRRFAAEQSRDLKNSIIVAERTAVSARDSADASIRTAKLMEESIEKQLRAYVCQVAGSLQFDQEELPQAHVVVKNCGLTPAYNVRQWIAIDIKEWPLKSKLSQPPGGFQISTAVLAPNDHVTMPVPVKQPLSTREIALLGSAVCTVYIYGDVRYRDAFGFERYTKYQLVYRGVRNGEEGALSHDVEGNEAN